MKLRCDSVHFGYDSDSPLFNGVEFSFDSGESIALAGENGAGKTTLLKLLVGLLRPQQGRILLDEQDISQQTVAALSRSIGYVSQNPTDQLFCSSVLQEISFYLDNLKLPTSEKNQRVEQALDTTGLFNDRHKHPYDLIPARQKLVTIASVLAMETPIIVLDEPTDGQDDLGQKTIAGIIAQLKAKGRTVVSVSHDMEFIADNLSRVLLLSKGVIALDGSVPDILVHQQELHQARLTLPLITRLAKTLGITPVCATENDFKRLYRQKFLP